MNKEIVNPISLKGQDALNRVRELMGKVSPTINEEKVNSVLEISQKGPDGKIYGIVRENHDYYIKIADNKKNLTVKDFEYIGGLANKRDMVYESYAKATKHLKLKFISLAEAYGIEHDKDTNILLKEGGFGFGFGDEGNMDNFNRDNEYFEEDYSEEMVDRGNDGAYSQAFDSMERNPMEDYEQEDFMRNSEPTEDYEQASVEVEFYNQLRDLKDEYGDLTINELLDLIEPEIPCESCNESLKKKVLPKLKG